MTQWRLSDCHSVYRGAIAAIEISNLVTVAVPENRTLAAGQRRIVNGEQIGRVASDVNLAVEQGKSRVS
jgi:hypothetical protein